MGEDRRVVIGERVCCEPADLEGVSQRTDSEHHRVAAEHESRWGERRGTREDTEGHRGVEVGRDGMGRWHIRKESAAWWIDGQPGGEHEPLHKVCACNRISA